MGTYERLNVRPVGDVAVVHFCDARIVDGPSVRELASELYDLVEDGAYHKLVLSFASVEMLSSEGLGKLVTLRKLAEARRAELKLSDLGPELARVFSVTRLDRLFAIEPDEAAAVAAFATPSLPLDADATPHGPTSQALPSRAASVNLATL
jgi:anti-anti-sigma factor